MLKKSRIIDRKSNIMIIELEEINNFLLNEPIIAPFCDGKYTNDIRETMMTLTTECGDSCKKVY